MRRAKSPPLFVLRWPSAGRELIQGGSPARQDTSQLKNAIAAQTRPAIQASITIPMVARYAMPSGSDRSRRVGTAISAAASCVMTGKTTHVLSRSALSRSAFVALAPVALCPCCALPTDTGLSSTPPKRPVIELVLNPLGQSTSVSHSARYSLSGIIFLLTTVFSDTDNSRRSLCS